MRSEEMVKYINMIKKHLLFSEVKEVEKFVIEETEEDNENAEKIFGNESKDKPAMVRNEGLLLNKKKASRNEDARHKEVEKSETSQKSEAVQTTEISKNLSDNLEHIKRVYNIPLNGDMILREFDIVVKEKAIPAFIIFFDGMADRSVINDNILTPLMVLSNMDVKGNEKNIANFVKNHILPHNQLKQVTEYKKVIEEVNFGGCGLFIDGIDSAFAADVKGWEHRGVERPNTEQTLRGPQEGFTEVLRVNTALVRKILKDEDLIVENLEIGKRSKTPCSILYIKDITNNSLINEVRRRIKSLRIDYIFDSGELEQYIEDNTFLPTPQILATERPDRTASLLAEGKVAIILQGNPFALVVPATLTSLIHSPEDAYFRFPYANLLRLVRIMGIVFALLLPGIYVAITNFHHEMIPTGLLFAIEASREKVPFPSVVEILIMEVSFELIREAGIRIPSPIGPTLGIIGALILGQAAVAANIVSPILIIIVAVTGIGSFAIPNFSLALAFRILRFVYIILGATVGFLGITVGLFIHGITLVSAKSFGVPIAVPFAPKTVRTWTDSLLRSPIWKQELRPDFQNTKKRAKQSKISRGWTKGEKGDEHEE
jgi:spore germination protein KA